MEFIFLEFLDSEINALIHGLRHEFMGDAQNTNVHITVRGPYYEKIEANLIESFERQLGAEPILIHSAGMFRNKEYVVYIKIESLNLKRIWWKPDYPIESYGFNPHITIYKGSNKSIAECAYEFLRSENIKLLCHAYKLTSYVSKQYELFPDEFSPRAGNFLGLSNRRLIKPDILQRAANVVRQCNKGSAGNS
ncbi:MAG: hypothetical protein AB2552_19185 [Candidatus Thiodiazotropha endolucinida]